jgi:hypothetical protein
MNPRSTAGTRRAARRWTAVLALVALAGCSSDGPTLPVAEGDALMGHVRVLSRISGDTSTDSLGVLTLDDVSAMRVGLEMPNGSTTSAPATNGAFEFRYHTPGLYRASFVLFPGETLAVVETTLTSGNATFPDTLVVPTSGVVHTYPSPFPHYDPNTALGGLAIECDVPSLQTVEVRILAMSGAGVRADSVANYPAGFFHYHWISNDDARNPVPPGRYWVALRLDGAHHVDMVVME